MLGRQDFSSFLRGRSNEKVDLAVSVPLGISENGLKYSHPYDDPEYLKTLPEDHPAHPQSKEAQEARRMADAETLALRQRQQERSERRTQPQSHDDSDRNWFQKKKDKLIGTKEEREKAREEKRRAKEEQKRRIRVGNRCTALLTTTGG